MRRQKAPKKNFFSLHRKLATTLLSLVIIAGAAAGVYYALSHESPAKKPVVMTTGKTASPNTKGETSAPNSSTPTPSTPSSGTSNAPQPGDDKNNINSTDTHVTLLVPSGNFVSNHHPNLSGSPAPNQLESSCNTTPGATCQIIFTKGSVTKTLPSQTTDRGGAAFWTWTLQNIGLAEGTWQVQAKATLGNQTQTATDALTLEVKQ